ncbi:protein FAM131A isoform X2 [Brienomyrus brachyistius]|uniref:protein FAM131A isoform X2 n=1 Tax=Brienomyrus brachyistius TaxID=42636 RepID=UPI0020B4549C|nr:protein FAM131A isoform X2 [Brienomyrus brachyistius]
MSVKEIVICSGLFLWSRLVPGGLSSVAVEEANLVNAVDGVEMLPKPRKALTIHEIAALAWSSLYGISQVVKEHVTKPTAMAQGRVAHLIEWKGWCKPVEPFSTLESHLTSYRHLSEGEQEARFAAGVAEQFAIAEAKLRAWSSVDDDDDEPNEDLHEEGFSPESELPQNIQVEGPAPSESPLNTRCSRFHSFEVQLQGHTPEAPASPTLPAYFASEILAALQGACAPSSPADEDSSSSSSPLASLIETEYLPEHDGSREISAMSLFEVIPLEEKVEEG